MSDAARAPSRGGPQPIPRPARVTPGPGAWWSKEGAIPPATVALAQVRRAFEATDRPARDDADVVTLELVDPDAGAGALDDRLPMRDPRPAAVLCALFEEDGDTWLVLTRRSASMRSHTGEVAFPGGRLDAGETAMAAALREADEEVGLDPAAVEVIGRLRPLATMSSRSQITPFVAVLEGRPHLRPNPVEVERAFAVPLSELMAPGVYHEEHWVIAGEGRPRAIHFFDLADDTIWGATAMMLRELLDRISPAPG